MHIAHCYFISLIISKVFLVYLKSFLCIYAFWIFLTTAFVRFVYLNLFYIFIKYFF